MFSRRGRVCVSGRSRELGEVRVCGFVNGGLELFLLEDQVSLHSGKNKEPGATRGGLWDIIP